MNPPQHPNMRSQPPFMSLKQPISSSGMSVQTPTSGNYEIFSKIDLMSLACSYFLLFRIFLQADVVARGPCLFPPFFNQNNFFSAAQCPEVLCSFQQR